MTCKDCIHYELCSYDEPDINMCELFRDKSLIVELPCKARDKYYRISVTCSDGGYSTKGEHFPSYSDCEYCCDICDKEYVVTEHQFYSVIDILNSIDCIGKTVFLTREEAENALKERNK